MKNEIIQPPVYWHSSVEQVNEDISKIKIGKVTELLPSAGNKPIYMIEYGKKTVTEGKANLSSACGAQDVRCYADKTKDGYIPTVFMVGCMHGGEFEGTVAMMNLISLLETGVDLAGNRNDKLLDLAKQLRLVLIPMSNPDGRSRIPFDNFVGHTFRDLRYYNQGTWNNGELCGWPGCKAIHPIKGQCEFMGAYFNDDGINMIHDDFFINPSNESKNVIKAAMDNAPDFCLYLHGGGNTYSTFFPDYYMTNDAKRQIFEIGAIAEKEYEKEGLIFKSDVNVHAEGDAHLPPFTIECAVFNVCGEPSVTFEANQGLTECEDKYCLTNDEIYRSHTLFFEILFDWVLKNKNAEKQRERLEKMTY